MSNLNNNRLNVTMTAAQITAVKTALTTIATNMPFLTGLTVEERQSLPKIDVSNYNFTKDAINAAVNNSAMLPSFINTSAMQTDLQLFDQIDELQGMIAQTLERLRDTQMLAGSESYVSALACYKMFAAAAESGVSGSDTVYEQLKQRFANNGSSSASTGA